MKYLIWAYGLYLPCIKSLTAISSSISEVHIYPPRKALHGQLPILSTWVLSKRRVTRAGTAITPSLKHPLTLTSTGQSEIRVLKDDVPVERTEYNDREVADSDQQLGMPFTIPCELLHSLIPRRAR